MDKSRIINGLAIMAGLIVVGISIPRAVVKLKAYDRTVSVRGLCEREVMADKVIWPITFKTVGNELPLVYEKIEQRNATVISFLRKGGIDEKEITVGNPSVSDKLSQEYGSNDRLYRFVASSTVTVCTKDVDKVLALMSSLKTLIRHDIIAESGWGNEAVFSFEGLNEIKPAMIEEATKNAREVAQKFADDSGSRLGKIKSASQGYFTIEDRDSNTPYFKKVRVVTNVDFYL